MCLGGKGLGFESDQFFFPNAKFSVSNKIFGQFFVCLSVVGLVVTSWNQFFCCAHFSSMLLLLFDLLRHMVFSFFFVSPNHCLTIGLLKFLFFSVWKIISKFIGKI